MYLKGNFNFTFFPWTFLKSVFYLLFFFYKTSSGRSKNKTKSKTKKISLVGICDKKKVFFFILLFLATEKEQCWNVNEIVLYYESLIAPSFHKLHCSTIGHTGLLILLATPQFPYVQEYTIKSPELVQKKIQIYGEFRFWTHLRGGQFRTLLFFVDSGT